MPGTGLGCPVDSRTRPYKGRPQEAQWVHPACTGRWQAVQEGCTGAPQRGQKACVGWVRLPQWEQWTGIGSRRMK